MKMLLQTIVAGFFFILPITAVAQSTSEHEAVKLVMQNLLRAFETDDADLLCKTFRSDGVLVGYSKRTGKVVLRSGDEFAKGFTGKPADDEAQRKRSFEILDVTENAAVAKLMLDYPTWKGVDYMALSKIDGQWKIISKSWNVQAKPTPQK
jgi:Putative lumazine-binding